MFGHGTSIRWTKADQMRFAVEQGYEIETARKGGHNRLDFVTTDGRRCFMLHKTVVATLSEDGAVLTLDGGGYPTMTTTRAMNDALDLFKVAGFVSRDRNMWEFRGLKFVDRLTYSLASGRVVAGLGGSSVPIEDQAQSVQSAIGSVLWDVELGCQRKEANSLREAIVKRGFTSLGKGCFSQVYVHEKFPDVVIKVGRLNDGGMEDGFLKYADFIKSSKTTNSLAVRIFHTQVVTKEGQGSYFAVIERCYAAPSYNHVSAVTSAANFVKGRTFNISGRSKRAINFLSKLAKLGDLDVHGDNVMMRKCGQLVVTDPLVVR